MDKRNQLQTGGAKIMNFIKQNFQTLLALCIAILFIVYGLIRSEVGTILIKAIRICLECIGIG